MLIVVLGLVLYGVVAVLGLWMSSDETTVGYSSERMVEAAYRAHVPTTYTPSAAGNSAVAVPMSAGQGTPFRHTYVPAANYTVSTPVLNGGSYASQGLLLTSQQRQQSYGGSATGTSASARMGGGSAGGSYAMGGYASSASALGGYSSGIYSSGNSYSSNAGGGISVHGNMTSTFSPSVYASVPAPYASFNNTFGSSTLGGVVSSVNPTAASGTAWLPVRASGRRYAPPGSIDDTYLDWLNGVGEDNGYLYTDENGVRYYDMNKLRAWYESQFGGTDTPYLSWEDFLEQIFNQHDDYQAPLPDGCLWMLLLAMGLALYIRKKTKCTRSADILR